MKRPRRSSSTGKLAILLSAVQLREDVRRVWLIKRLSAEEFDDLFRTIWRVKSTKSWITAIGKKHGEHAPRISTIFDLTADPPDFFGAKKTTSRSGGDIDVWLARNYGIEWESIPILGDDEVTFYDRLKLAGKWSDNRAAASCMSEIGLPYIAAVQRAYRLSKMNMLIGKPFGDTIGMTEAYTRGAIKHRSLGDYGPPNRVTTTALTAFMIWLMRERFGGQGAGDPLSDIKDECDTIKDLLADKDYGIWDTISQPFKGNPELTVVRSKVGYLGKTVEDDCTFRNEFTYLEIGQLKYAVIVTGLISLNGLDGCERGESLSRDIHDALL